MRPRYSPSARLPVLASRALGTPATRPCFRFPACISESESPAPVCAESAHASVRLLAASLQTIGSEQKSAALSGGFSNVAAPATGAWLPLHAVEDPKRKPAGGLRPATTRPVVRESRSVEPEENRLAERALLGRGRSPQPMAGPGPGACFPLKACARFALPRIIKGVVRCRPGRASAPHATRASGHRPPRARIRSNREV